MKKSLTAVLFAVLTVGVSALCFAAWRPVHPVPVQEELAPAREAHPVVLETSSVLVLVGPVQEAPKPRPVAARAKTYACGGWEASQVGGSYKRCDWR